MCPSNKIYINHSSVAYETTQYYMHKIAFFSDLYLKREMARSLRIVFGLLIFVTLGVIIGGLIQLAFIPELEDSYGSGSSFGRRLGIQQDTNLPLMKGMSIWGHDHEAAILRLGYVKPEIMSWSPRIILFRNFLSTEECDCLKEIAMPRLQPSMVVDDKSGKSVKSDERTSSGMFLYPQERMHPILQAIEKRISVYSQLPTENSENMQILRYEKNQYYRAHHDYFDGDALNLKNGGLRVATMIMFLSDNIEGGETHFPMAGSGECSCGGKLVKGVCIKPAKADAVLFWNKGLDGQFDPKSIHGGCEVLSGEKWSATQWISIITRS